MRAPAQTPQVVDRMLWHALIVGVVATLVAAVVAGSLVGPWLQVAGSVGLAGALVTGSLAAGVGAIRWLLTQHDAVILPGAFAVLLIVVVLLAAAALLLREVDWLARPAFALAALGSAILFQVVLVWSYLTGPRPLLDVAMPQRAED